MPTMEGTREANGSITLRMSEDEAVVLHMKIADSEFEADLEEIKLDRPVDQKVFSDAEQSLAALIPSLGTDAYQGESIAPTQPSTPNRSRRNILIRHHCRDPSFAWADQSPRRNSRPTNTQPLRLLPCLPLRSAPPLPFASSASSSRASAPLPIALPSARQSQYTMGISGGTSLSDLVQAPRRLLIKRLSETCWSAASMTSWRWSSGGTRTTNLPE